MKRLLLNSLLYCYHNIAKSNRVRKSIKKLIGSSKIVIPFNGFKINVGTNSAIESNLIFDSYNEFSILKLIKKLMKLTKAILDFKNSKIGKNKDS